MIANKKMLSVSELSKILKACFENPAFSDLTVYGEVYSIRLGKFSYIDLGDQGHKETNSPLLRVAFSCFYGNQYGLEDIKVGDVISVTGNLSYYPHGSSITLWGNKAEILQSQLGKSLLEKKKTLEKLDKLGYLDSKRKKSIPPYCKKIAILTAASGAAYQDILKTLHERFPLDSVLYPTVVQGDGAKRSILRQLRRAKEKDFDVIILGRGGGSKTDLSCFDDEDVAMEIATSTIPIITCIGHTIDTAIADRVSDASAITPTEGASLVNRSLKEVIDYREDLRKRLENLFINKLQNEALNLERYLNTLESLSPQKKVSQKAKDIKDKKRRLCDLYRQRLDAYRNDIDDYQSTLSSQMKLLISYSTNRLMSYKSALAPFDPTIAEKHGYALVFKDGIKVTSASQLKDLDTVEITYTDGRKRAIVSKED